MYCIGPKFGWQESFVIFFERKKKALDEKARIMVFWATGSGGERVAGESSGVTDREEDSPLLSC